MKNTTELEQELKKIEEQEKSLKKHKELLLKQLNEEKVIEDAVLINYQQKFKAVNALLYRDKYYYYIEYNNVIISKFSTTYCDYLTQTMEKSLILLTVVNDLKDKLNGTIGVDNIYSWGAIRCYVYTNPKEENVDELKFSMDINILSDNNLVGNITYSKELYAEEYVVEKNLDYEIIVQSSNDQVSLEVLYDWKFNANKDNVTDVAILTLAKLTNKILTHQKGEITNV